MMRSYTVTMAAYTIRMRAYIRENPTSHAKNYTYTTMMSAYTIKMPLTQ